MIKLQLPSEPLSGTHLRLNRFVEADVGELFRSLDHDEVWAHVAGRRCSSEQYLPDLLRAPDNGRYPWVLRLQQDLAGLPAGAVVGTTSYLDFVASDERCEIGFTSYSPAVWGSTVNPEAKLLLLGAAFDAGIGRVQLKTDIRNLRSQRAIAGIGATREGVLRQYQRRDDGSIRDTVMFSVLADEWPEVRQGLIRRTA